MYICVGASGDESSCGLNFVCDQSKEGISVDYHIDKTYPFYHWNWYQELRRYDCMPIYWTFRGMSTIYNLTNAVAGLYIGWVPDHYGRKTTVVCALGAQLLV